MRRNGGSSFDGLIMAPSSKLATVANTKRRNSDGFGNRICSGFKPTAPRHSAWKRKRRDRKIDHGDASCRGADQDGIFRRLDRFRLPPRHLEPLSGQSERARKPWAGRLSDPSIAAAGAATQPWVRPPRRQKPPERAAPSMIFNIAITSSSTRPATTPTSPAWPT